MAKHDAEVNGDDSAMGQFGNEKDIAEKAVRAVVDHLQRALYCADELDDKLQLSLEPTWSYHPTLLGSDRMGLRWLFRGLMPRDKADLDTLLGCGVEVGTFLSTYGALNRRLHRSIEWILGLLDDLEKDVLEKKSRPSPELVDSWHKATALLHRGFEQAQKQDIPSLRKIAGISPAPEAPTDTQETGKHTPSPERQTPEAEGGSVAVTFETVSDYAVLSPASLASVFGVPQEALRKRLAIYRKTDHGCFIEPENPGSRDARHLYYVGKVRHIIEKLTKKMSSETASTRPAKKK